MIFATISQIQILTHQIQLQNGENLKYIGSVTTMLPDVHVKLNPEFPFQKQHYTTRRPFFHQKNLLKFEEEISKLLRLKHSFVTCWNLDTSDGNQKCLESWRRSVGPIV
jgi:hypothetical protein